MFGGDCVLDWNWGSVVNVNVRVDVVNVAVIVVFTIVKIFNMNNIVNIIIIFVFKFLDNSI